MIERLKQLKIVRESSLFLILAEHTRDKARLIRCAREYAKGRQISIVCIVREPRTFPRIILEKEEGVDSRTLLSIGWPSTNHGTNLDGGVGLEARFLKRFLTWLFPQIDTIFVSDIVGDQAALTCEFQVSKEICTIFVPEGLSVLANEGQSRWVERKWRSAVGLIVRDTILEAFDLATSIFRRGRERRWARKKRPLWRLWRVARLCLFRPADPRNWRLAQVDIVMSDWPESVALPVSFREFLPIRARFREISNAPMLRNSVVLIGQPMEISVSTWKYCLRNLRDRFPEVRDVMVRTHPDSLGQNELIEAARIVFSSEYDTALRIDFRGEPEAPSPEQFEMICGVSSTLLFEHLVWAPSKSLVVCLYHSLLRVATNAERAELKKQESTVQVLQEFANGGRFVFLEDLNTPGGG